MKYKLEIIWAVTAALVGAPLGFTAGNLLFHKKPKPPTEQDLIDHIVDDIVAMRQCGWSNIVIQSGGWIAAEKGNRSIAMPVSEMQKGAWRIW
jgi:hypothetical protein